MWPKALTQLVEIAPHIVRLLPMADRFFQSKSAEADASRTAMEQMAEGLRGDLGQVTASHAGLYRQLNEQSEKLSNIGADQQAVKLSIQSAEARLSVVGASVLRLTYLVYILVALVGVTLVLLAYLIFHHG